MISYVQEPGEPQYAAVVRRWTLDATPPAGLFMFEAPEGAQKVEPPGLRPPAPSDAAPAPVGPEGGH